jgi:hypothetical protein
VLDTASPSIVMQSSVQPRIYVIPGGAPQLSGVIDLETVPSYVAPPDHGAYQPMIADHDGDGDPELYVASRPGADVGRIYIIE